MPRPTNAVQSYHKSWKVRDSTEKCGFGFYGADGETRSLVTREATILATTDLTMIYGDGTTQTTAQLDYCASIQGRNLRDSPNNPMSTSGCTSPCAGIHSAQSFEIYGFTPKRLLVELYNYKGLLEDNNYSSKSQAHFKSTPYFRASVLIASTRAEFPVIMRLVYRSYIGQIMKFGAVQLLGFEGRGSGRQSGNITMAVGIDY